jgi:hypothetical protein
MRQDGLFEPVAEPRIMFIGPVVLFQKPLVAENIQAHDEPEPRDIKNELFNGHSPDPVQAQDHVGVGKKEKHLTEKQIQHAADRSKRSHGRQQGETFPLCKEALDYKEPAEKQERYDPDQERKRVFGDGRVGIHCGALDVVVLKQKSGI